MFGLQSSKFHVSFHDSHWNAASDQNNCFKLLTWYWIWKFVYPCLVSCHKYVNLFPFYFITNIKISTILTKFKNLFSCHVTCWINLFRVLFVLFCFCNSCLHVMFWIIRSTRYGYWKQWIDFGLEMGNGLLFLPNVSIWTKSFIENESIRFQSNRKCFPCARFKLCKHQYAGKVQFPLLFDSSKLHLNYSCQFLPPQ